MDHIQDVYKKKPEMIEKIWDNLTKVNLKVDGKPFQVVYNEEEDELEYHGRSGNETKVGPLIDDMYRLFSKPINDAIRHIENRVEVFKRYKFLTFEVIDEILLLTAIIDKKGKFIDDPDDIDDIAKELDTDVMPCLWKGKISEEQKEVLMQAISTDIVPTKDEFVKWVKELFGSYSKFPKSLISRSSEFIEGIVFFYEVDGKVVEYKLVDPTFRQMVKDNHAGMKKDSEDNAEKYNEIYKLFLNWAEENATGLDKNRMRSIEFNFIKMMEDAKLYNKLMKLGTGLTTITTDAYFLQPDRISDELKKAIKKHGKVYQLLYEKFVRLFYKAKKRGFVISKEFQQRVNKVTEKFAEYSLNEDEIEINGEVIISEAYNIAFDNKQDDYNNFLKILKISDENTRQIVMNLFNLVYSDEDGLKPISMPFRYSNKSVKLSRKYEYNKKFIEKLKSFATIESNGFKLNNTKIKIIWGEGSIKGENKGITFEKIYIDNFFDNYKEQLCKDLNIEPTKIAEKPETGETENEIIKHEGSKNNKRSLNFNEIVNDYPNIGEIITDVTLLCDNKSIYLSLKHGNTTSFISKGISSLFPKEMFIEKETKPNKILSMLGIDKDKFISVFNNYKPKSPEDKKQNAVYIEETVEDDSKQQKYILGLFKQSIGYGYVIVHENNKKEVHNYDLRTIEGVEKFCGEYIKNSTKIAYPENGSAKRVEIRMDFKNIKPTLVFRSKSGDIYPNFFTCDYKIKKNDN